MQDFLVILWSFHDRGGSKAAFAMLTRCDLRHEARQMLEREFVDLETGVPRIVGSLGSVRLKTQDSRIPKLLSELERADIKPTVRTERTYSRKDLEAPWLTTVTSTTMVISGIHNGQVWDFTASCRTCGANAVPKPPLIVRFHGEPPKQGWSVSAPHGLVIVSSEVAAAVVNAKLSGFALEPVRTPSREVADGRFRWLRIPCTWPAPIARPGCCVSGSCEECGRPQRHRAPEPEVSVLHFDRVPADAKDFNAWQGTKVQESQRFADVNRPRGAVPELIISQRAYRVLKDAGVKSLKCEPVRFG